MVRRIRLISTWICGCCCSSMTWLPRVPRCALADLIRLGGSRPLNVLRQPGQVVRLALTDPAGSWAQAAPHCKVSLAWKR